MSGGVWAPYKELASTVNAAILGKEPDAYYSLEAVLKKHKPDFISLLNNPAKNSTHRQQILKSVKEGLSIPSLPNVNTLPQEFVDETIILSDILNLNELSAAELMVAGEQQLSRLPRLTRGLVAVLLYHDGRRTLVSVLRTLIQAREGVCWTLDLPTHTTDYVTKFTDELLEEGLVDRILSLLGNITVEAELEKLSRGRAVGGPKHRAKVVELIEEQRSCLVDCLFYWACQNPFSKENTIKILCHLQKVTLATPAVAQHAIQVPVGRDQNSKVGVANDYKEMNSIDCVLFHTLLACFNIGDSTPESSGDDSLADDHYPIMADGTFVPTVHSVVTTGSSNWSTPALYSAVQFAWGILLRECASRALFDGLSELEDDEALVDEAIKNEALFFIRRSVMKSSQFHQEEYCVRKMHHLLTSLIINMPLKIKELRNHGDDVARELTLHGLLSFDAVPNGRRGFEELLMLIGDIYSTDPNDLNLSLEFWSPAVDHTHQHSGLHHRIPQRQIGLYKFISTCSDLLPAPLFPALMHMLVGLSSSAHSAHHAFNFLKANSPSLGGGGASAAISLEHFFLSLKQYYLELKKIGGAKITPTGSAITPLELDGLRGVLSLIRTIAKHDENARVVMYDNQSWLPVASLFGLVGCPVPRELKADILQTLATFALTPQIAASMWHTLEISQVLNTTSSKVNDERPFGHRGIQDGGIQVELDELESQLEEYSLTRSFLSLLNALTEVMPPSTLGVGHRIPGFEPYLEFIRDNVFLRFDSRSYRNSNEKWEVASLALEVLHKLIVSHEIKAEDFVCQYRDYEPPEKGVVPSPPGHTLLVHMLNDSKLHRKICWVIDEAFRRLSDLSAISSEPLAHTALLCLKIIETSFSREQEFLDQLRRSHAQNISVSPLHELLGSINPRTNKADYIVTIAKYVSLTASSPELALSAIQTLTWVSQSHFAGSKAVKHIISDREAWSDILQGFVEHLEMEIEDDIPTQDESLATVAGVRQAVKLTILKLLSICVNNPSPNVAHLLLGYETSMDRHVSETTLQDPGVLGAPRTCLHSILSLLEQLPGSDFSCHYSYPKLAELCYKLIYQLCASRQLSMSTLRYLRSNHDFFFTQLTHFPLNIQLLADDEEEVEGKPDEQVLNSRQVSLVHQQAWFLKTVAIELRLTSKNHQRSHAQRIVNLLLNEPTDQTEERLNHMSNPLGTASDHFGPLLNVLHESKRKVLVLLDMVDFSDKVLPSLDIHFFVKTALEQAIQSCDTKESVSGLQYTDVKVLHKMLMGELSTLQGATASGQRQSVLDEIHEILTVVVGRNRVLESNHSYNELFESWRQLVEVMLHSLAHVGVKQELKVDVLFELIQDSLLKVANSDTSELTSAVHGVIFILMSHLRQSLSSSSQDLDIGDNILSSLYVGRLHAILKGLVENVLRSPSGNQKVRAYLYGALLYYLVLTKQEEEDKQTRGASLWRSDREEDILASGNLAILSSFGEPFMDMVCKNACSWHAVARMLSLSLLDAVICQDWQNTWLKFLCSKGYLQNLCASIQWEDESLKKMTTPTPESLRALYIYKSKMAFLTRVANNQFGGSELVSLNAVNSLSQCQFIDNRPGNTDGFHGNDMQGGFVPSVADRYQQSLLPLLKFLLALLTSPGAHHKEACTQVTELIGAHSDVFATILKEQHQVITMATLQELALVTAVIGHSDVGHDWSSQLTTPLGSGLVRLQRLVLSLLPQFWSKKNWSRLVQQVLQCEADEGEQEGVDVMAADEASLLAVQISANLVSYCRVAMTTGGMEPSSPYCSILMSPDLSEAMPMSLGLNPFPSVSSSAHPASLGLLIQHLKECLEGYTNSLESHQQKTNKLKAGGRSLSVEDIKTLLPGSVSVDKLSSAQQVSLAQKTLKKLISNKKQEMEYFAYIVENLVYLLWRHLQYYLVHCKPVNSDPLLVAVNRTPMRRMQDISSDIVAKSTFDLSSLGDGVRNSDIEQLKADIVKCLSDHLFKQLLDLEENQVRVKAEVRVGFIQALVRRVRRLLKLKANAKPML